MPFFSKSNKNKPTTLGKPTEVIRISVLGASQTGKTSLVQQFLNFKFSQKYRPTIDDVIQLSYPCGNTTYEVELVDATGSFEFPAMRKLYIDTSNAFIVVMSVDLPESVEEARQLLSMIHRRRNSTVNISESIPPDPLTSQMSRARILCAKEQEPPRVVFVVNKMDLPDINRKVDVNAIQEDPQFGFENVVLTSAKENWNVDETFSRLMDKSKYSSNDSLKMEKTLEAALQHRRATAPVIDLGNASDSFLLALKNSVTSPSKEQYIPIGP